MRKAQETLLEIDLDALRHNVEYLKSKLRPKTKFLAVVKAFGYGTEAVQMARFLETQQVDYFAVAYTSEGVALRTGGVTCPILVFHPQVINFKTLIKYDLEPSLYSQKSLKLFIDEVSKTQHKSYPVHIKWNTGLNRLGFRADELSAVAASVNNTQAIAVHSLFSHLAASEDLSAVGFTRQQIATFVAIADAFTKATNQNPMRHICNTSGILNYPGAHFDMVRSGIGLHGFGNSETMTKQFKPIATLKTIISQLHHLKKGDYLGYNQAFQAVKKMTTATLPIGHADGISRAYGNGRGYVYIDGVAVPIIGNVCMDMIMVDVTDINCKEGDTVIIFGKTASAVSFSASGSTISYELIAGISQRIRRIFLKKKNETIFLYLSVFVLTGI